jgi:hypothetical protein
MVTAKLANDHMIRIWNINRAAIGHFDGKLPKWLGFDLCSDLFVHSASSVGLYFRFV